MDEDDVLHPAASAFSNDRARKLRLLHPEEVEERNGTKEGSIA